MEMASKKRKILPAALLLVFILTACSKATSVVLPVVEDYDRMDAADDKKDLKLGVVAGPYGDLFLDAIQPYLAKMGYTVELVFYEDYLQPNLALAANEIDLNMFQHYTYLNNFKFEYDLALSAIAKIPTVSMGVFSLKYKKLNDLEDGASISIPSDSTNLSRALRVLDAAGIVTIDPSVDKTKATENDLIKNPKNLQFSLVEAHLLVQSLNTYDISVINGNFAWVGGLNLSRALYTEILDENYINVITVRTEDLNKQFVRDILDAVDSEEYRNAIMGSGGKYSQFQRPLNFFNK